MLAELIQVQFHKIMQTRAYTVILLGTEKKQFAIYTEASVGRTLQLALTGSSKPRPLTHDLMQLIFQGYDVSVKQIVLTDIQDTIYFCRLFLEQQRDQVRHILEIDARPSDCITLALLHNAPVYCTRDVFERALPVEEE